MLPIASHLSNANNSVYELFVGTKLNGFPETETIYHQLFVCTHLNGYTYIICTWIVFW